MRIKIKDTWANVYKIYYKRALCYCPFHQSKKGGADLDVTIEGLYSGKFFCWGCGTGGRVSDEVIKYLRSMRQEESKPADNKNWTDKAKDYQLNMWKQYVQPPFDYISPHIWTQLGLGWDGKSWTIPMRNEKGEITGINRRFPDGNKGNLGKLGLIVPKMNFDSRKTLYITEGCGDLVVVLELGFQGMARPNSNSCKEIVDDWIEQHIWTGPIIIIADDDKAGLAGAAELDWVLCGRGSVTQIPPIEDLRETYLQKGSEWTKNWLEHISQ